MKQRGKTKYSVAWIGMLAYLFLCLMNSQTAMALASAMAGPHEIVIVSDGNHRDVIFTHEQMKSHQHTHTHGYDHHHESNEDNIGLLFDAHHDSHPDHVIHLAEHHEQISTHVPVLQLDLQYLHHIAMPTAVMAPLPSFLKTVSLQQLPQPPPRLPSQLASLRTIILLI